MKLMHIQMRLELQEIRYVTKTAWFGSDIQALELQNGMNVHQLA